MKFEEAVRCWKSGRLTEYEGALADSSKDCMNALELTYKVYLRRKCFRRMPKSKQWDLRKLNFPTLLELMEEYADPPLSEESANILKGHWITCRNMPEHEPAIPPAKSVLESMQLVRGEMVKYLGLEETGIPAAPDMGLLEREVEVLRSKYFVMLTRLYRNLDLTGISPSAGIEDIRVKTADVFVNLRLIRKAAFQKAELEDLLERHNMLGCHTPDTARERTEDDVERLIHFSRSELETTSFSDLVKQCHVVLLGDPGSGKTTLCKHLAYSIAAKEGYASSHDLRHMLPILISASSFASRGDENEEKGLFGYIIEHHLKEFGPLFEHALRNGECLVMVDGLDEIADVRSRRKVVKNIEKMASEMPDNKIFITSRVVGYAQNQVQGDFQHLVLSKLDDTQIQWFISNWLRTTAGIPARHDGQRELNRRAEELWKGISSSPGIRKLAGNPLLLTIIVMAARRGAKLPSKRVILYDKITKTLVEDWSLNRDTWGGFEVEDVLGLLEPVAFEIMRSSETNLIPENRLRPIIEKGVCDILGVAQENCRSKAREVITAIAEGTGFFSQWDYDEHRRRLYGFMHFTFTEYLAARYMAAEFSAGTLDLARFAHDPRWHEVMLLMAGHVGY